MNLGALILSSILALSALSAPGPSGPESPQPRPSPARVLNLWLAAFDSGDMQTFQSFLQRKYPSEIARADRDLAFERMTGGLDLRKVISVTPDTVTAYVQEKASDEFGRIRLRLQDFAPYRIADVEVQQIQRPAEFALPHLSRDALVAALSERVEREAAAGRFAGVVLLAKDGRPIFEKAYGLADRARNAPNTDDTRFRIGSMNKMFTAVAIMQLAQSGRINLDKPFGDYLPEYPNKAVSQSVTIRELLTHTGGTGDIFGPDFEKNRLKLRALQDYIDLYGNRPLRFKPGSRWEYSNYGFILLGAVVQHVSGEDYYDYVDRHIYAAAGMTSSGSLPEAVNVANRSIGYTQMLGESLQPNTDTLPYRASPAGGGYSTAGDLLRFANALQTGKLLAQASTQMLLSGKVSTPMGGRYAFGFEDRVINGSHCYGHGGGAPGMNGDLEICRAAGYVVVVLSNLDPPAATRISDFITNRLPLH